MTIHEAQQQLLFQLYDIYDDREAQSITNWVMEHITEWKKIDRILNKKIPLSQTQQAELQQITEQLLAHKPIHYILHQAWFQGMTLYVDERVLIPRPETEELVEWMVEAVKKLEVGSWHRLQQAFGNHWGLASPAASLRQPQEAHGEPGKQIKILDVGTGSGCIAIALKKKLPEAEIWACDVSEGALQVAARNATEQQTAIQLVQIDFLNADERNKLPVFDIIVSNPPYISVDEKSEIDKHVVEYEPHTALFVPEQNSLVFYEHLAAFGHTHLHPTGFMMMEIHYRKGEAVKKLFESKGYTVELRKDMQGNDRMIKVLLNPALINH